MNLLEKGNNYTANKTLSTEADIVGGHYEVYVTLSHEWGVEIVAKTRATRTGTKQYQFNFSSFNLRSNGIYKIKWEYIISGKSYTEYDSVKVYTPYAYASDFFDQYPYLNNVNNTNNFDRVEEKVRNIINTFCGQSFESFYDLYLVIDGSNKRTLSLPCKIQALNTVTATITDNLGNATTDETDNIEISPDSDWFIRWILTSGKFRTYATYTITGDWGWFYVPQNVTQAAELLIAEQFNDDNAYRNHGVTDLYMDTHRMRIDEKITFNSTGIIDADVLLMDYIKYQFDWV